jgi:hypothetical protein
MPIPATMHPSLRTLFLLAPVVALSFCSIALAGHPQQGLWVGDVVLNEVNEATGAVGNSNTYEFTNPETTTPTSDAAQLRLILHVNGAGQVSLLKSVAIVRGAEAPDGSAPILLITDPSLYPQFPGIAKRIASASFDFGSQSAVNAVDTLIDTATDSAVTKIRTDSASTAAAIETYVASALQPKVTSANVSLSYLNRATGATSFITHNFFSEANVITIANEVASQIHSGSKTAASFAFNPATDIDYRPFVTDPLGGSFTTRVNQAKTLKSNSFYLDTRGLEAIAGVVHGAALAAAGAPTGSDLALKQAIAGTAAKYALHNAADTTQAYNRFLTSTAFVSIREAIPAVAANIAIAAKTANESQAQIAASVRTALLANGPVSSAFVAAGTLKSQSLWSDIRAEDAVNAVVDAASNAASQQVMISLNPPPLEKKIREAIAAAISAIPSGPVFNASPSADYTGFVSAATFAAASTTAAKTAAAEVVFQYKAGVTGETELRFYAKRAVTKALTAIRESAAVIPQNEIRLLGSLAPGGSLSGSIHLPALAPTNPFMHRRHPDHTEGFPITRDISLKVDPADPRSSGLAGYGVSRISGTYFEEIFGLHKPLGPSKGIGLRTRGTFTLNRLSLANTLNF